MTGRRSFVVGLLLYLSSIIGSTVIAAADSTKGTAVDDRASDPPASIGEARMLEDRTIVLDLRAESPAGAIGDGRLTYPPSHPDYHDILDHIGGLSPGEAKPVPPWEP